MASSFLMRTVDQGDFWSKARIDSCLMLREAWAPGTGNGSAGISYPSQFLWELSLLVWPNFKFASWSIQYFLMIYVKKKFKL